MANPRGNPNMSIIGKTYKIKTRKKSELLRSKEKICRFSRSKESIPEETKEAFIQSGINPYDRRTETIRRIISSWINTYTTKGLGEILKIDKTLEMLHSSEIKSISKKLENQETLTNEEWGKMKILMEFWERLHKLKYGEKKTIQTVDFKDVLRLYNQKTKNQK